MNYLEIENVIGREIPLRRRYISQTEQSQGARLPAALPPANSRLWSFATAINPVSAARACPRLSIM